MILHQFGSTNLALFSRFTDCIRTGEGNAEKVLGSSIFQYMDDHPGRGEIYNKAMDHSSRMVVVPLLSAYDFSGIRHLTDIGGGRGILLAHILQHYPHMQGTLFDLPRVVEEATHIAETFGVQERLRIFPGDFSESIPAGADAYFMKNILHAFDDEKCLGLLKKIHAVMLPEGKLIILETVPARDNRPAFGKLADLLMMAGSVGGRERSREDFEALLHRSGFRISKLVRTMAPFHVIEAVKQNMSV
jgi:ubiquinone/menaquinone biosynthesis C-methylase UbiE